MVVPHTWELQKSVQSKKNQDLEQENYRPVSVLSHMSQVFESLMYIQTERFMEDKLSKLLTVFRKKL